MPTIGFDNVEKRYGRSGPAAVAGLSLDISDGDFLCLLGPSGCGKTTTLRMLAGLEHLTTGRITIGDKVVDDVDKGIFTPPEKRGLGMVFQSYALWPHLSVEKNVEFGLRLAGHDVKTRRDATESAMQRLGIDRYRDRYPSELSGGQQQRVALARTLVVEPEVILMDEPLSNLDAKLRLEMRAELKRIHAESQSTFVFVTHDQWEAMTLATTIAVMREGRLQQVGSPDDIYARPSNRFVAEFVGSPPINIVEAAEPDDALTTALGEYMASGPDATQRAAESFGIRPESIAVLASAGTTPSGTFSAPGTLTGVLPTGGSWILDIAVYGNRQVFAVTSVDPTFAEGSDVSIHVRPQDIHTFDADGIRIPAKEEVASPSNRLSRETLATK